MCVKRSFTHTIRKIKLYTFKQCNDVLYSYYKKKLFATWAKSLRPRDRPRLGSAAATLVRVYHSVCKVQLYALVTNIYVYVYVLGRASGSFQRRATQHSGLRPLCCTPWLYCILISAALKPSVHPLCNLADGLKAPFS